MSQVSRPRVSRLLLAIPLAALIACGGFRKVNIFTVPQELAIGEVFATEVQGVYPILDDPRLHWYLNHRGRMLADLSDRRDIPYMFHVVDSPELNAFAIPGGHIYINLGMIEACESEGQLMGVVAHEIGHVIAQHSMKMLSQQSIVNIVGTIALNQYPNQWAALAANLFGATGFLKMSRDAEREADAIGFQLMSRAGYDTHATTAIYEKLLQKYDEEPTLLDKLFSTHPPTRERIANIEAMIAAEPPPPGAIVTTPLYQEMYDHAIKEFYSESGRRRWKEVLEEKEKEEKGEDRLPWDTKSDEERRKRKAKEREEREKARREREEEAAREAPAPDPTPEPESEGGAAPGGAAPLVGAAGGAGGVR